MPKPEVRDRRKSAQEPARQSAKAASAKQTTQRRATVEGATGKVSMGIAKGKADVPKVRASREPETDEEEELAEPDPVRGRKPRAETSAAQRSAAPPAKVRAP